MAKGIPRTLKNVSAPLPVAAIPAATEDEIGGIIQAANQPASVAADVAALVTNFNTLLTNLKAAGIMVDDA